MKKQIVRFFSLLMLVVLLVTTFSMQVNARVVFDDLSPTHWCYNKIIDFEAKGYVCGYEDGTFRPDRTITRAEYVKIVNNFFGYKQNTENVADFSDVSSDDWFAPYVNEAVARGYIEGFEDGTFRPYDPIRRQEATVILARILDIDEEVYPANHVDGLAQYSDSDEVQDWARVAIHSYSVYNFINGYTDGTLRILQNVTRAETVELLHILDQKIVIDRDPEPTGKRKTTKMPTIALWQQIVKGPEVANISVELTKTGWVNKNWSTNRSGEDGVLVNITSTTNGATIYETLTGNKSGTRNYITTEIENLDNALFLTDGEYKVSAFADRTGYKTSSTAEKTILVDTKAPEVKGNVLTKLEGTNIAHEFEIKVNIIDPKAVDVNKISGLDESKVRYAWFKADDDGSFARVTEWTDLTLDESGNAVISTTAELSYGIYKLGVSALDIAENAYGERIDTIYTMSGDEFIPTEEIPYDFVEDLDKEPDIPERPNDDDIIIVIGNNAPEVEDLVMKTQVGVQVSKKIIASDKDNDELNYLLCESGDYEYAKVSGDTTTFKNDRAGVYYYNVEVDDSIDSATALVTVYVYDVVVTVPSGDPVIDPEKPNDPAKQPEYDITTEDVILYVGDTKDLTAKVNPEDADDKSYKWVENSDEIDITGDNDKETVEIEGKLPGKTTITVTATVDGVEITRNINIIVKSKITVTLPSYMKVYDGEKLSASDEFAKDNSEYLVGSKLSISGTTKEGDVFVISDVSGELMNVGKASVEKNGAFSVVGKNGEARTEYYEPTFVDGELEITPVRDTVTVTIKGNTASYEYDGTEKEVTGYEVTNISNSLYKEADFTFSGTAKASGTTAGTYKMNLALSQFTNKSDNFSNVEFIVTDGELEITPARDTVTVTIKGNTASYEYDGTEKEVTGYEVTNISNSLYKEADFTFTGTAKASGTTAGTYKMNLALSQFTNKSDNFSNVEFVVTDGELKITPASGTTSEITVEIKPKTYEYDGTEKEPAVTVKDGSKTLKNGTDYDVKYKDNINAGTATATITFKGNYNGQKEETFTITKRKITITSSGDSKEYDGTPLTNGNYVIAGSGLAIGQTAEVKITGTQTNVGSSKNTIESVIIKDNDKIETTANYDITKKEGTLEVTEYTPNVEIKSFTSNYPDAKGKYAEPGSKVDYVLVLENKESEDMTVKLDIATDGTIQGSYTIVYKDASGNTLKEETVDSIDNLTIPTGGTATITFKAKVDEEHPVNDNFETVATIETTTGVDIDEKTNKTKIQKSAIIVANNNKNKNIVLIVDLSGSMDDDGKIEALRKAAVSFTNKLKQDADAQNTDITLTLIGIGAGQGSDDTVTKVWEYYVMEKEHLWSEPVPVRKTDEETLAYKMGFYTNSNWSEISEYINEQETVEYDTIFGTYKKTRYKNFRANGGTNITGALEIAHEIIDAGSKYGATLIDENADTFTVLLTDGANGSDGKTRISSTNEDAVYLRENSTLFAIGFGEGVVPGRDGYSDLLAITNDADSIYSAASQTELDKAFDNIANKIGETQSTNGKIQVELPESGDYFPVTATHTVDSKTETLFVANNTDEFEENDLYLNEDEDMIIWDLSGTKYSALKDLKLTLGKNAPSGDASADDASLLIMTDKSMPVVEEPTKEPEQEETNSGDAIVEEPTKEPEQEETNSGDATVEEPTKEPEQEETNSGDVAVEEPTKEPEQEEINSGDAAVEEPAEELEQEDENAGDAVVEEPAEELEQEDENAGDAIVEEPTEETEQELESDEENKQPEVIEQPEAIEPKREEDSGEEDSEQSDDNNSENE